MRTKEEVKYALGLAQKRVTYWQKKNREELGDERWEDYFVYMREAEIEVDVLLWVLAEKEERNAYR